MTFKEWILSSYPNPGIDGQWGLGHILTLVFCIALIVTFALVFKNKSQKAKRILIGVMVGIILFFEISRRIINFIKLTDPSFHNIMHILLPRPGCAISCWILILAVCINKKSFYNFSVIIPLICAVIFFAYPGVGFNNEYILFENLYTIITHSLLLVTSISLLTLGFTKFEYKTIWKELVYYGVLLVYVFLEIYAFKIESDPLYFMPGNDVQEIVGLSYGAYLPLYILFMIVYWNSFYLISLLKQKIKIKRERKKIVLKNNESID